MIRRNTILYTISGLLLLLAVMASPVQAADGKLTSTFKNSEIDQSRIAIMLSAADSGHLYTIKANRSKMGFIVESSIGIVKGGFTNFQGGIALKGDAGQAIVSIDADSLETNISFVKDILKGDEFFNIENYPDLTFVSTDIEWFSNTRAVMKGELSMHGVTRRVAFYIEISELDGDLGDATSILIKATTTVQRSAFGMTALSSMVSDKVNLIMHVEAERYIAL